MTVELGDSANGLEGRIARLEQRSPKTESPMIRVTTDTVGGNPVASVEEPLDYSVGGWEPYAKLNATVDSVTGMPGGVWSDGAEGLLPPQVSRMGSTLFLSGVIKRATGPIPANTNQPNTPMFRLPTGWRPARSVLLACSCASSSVVGPEATVTMGTALIMIIPDLSEASGMVKLVTTSVQITAGTTGGWVALQGAFPASFT